MPKRKTTRRKVETPEAQGDDSWVVLDIPKWGQLKKMLGVGVDATEGQVSEAIRSTEMGDALMRTVTVEWNWVDFDDKPLPQPLDDKSVFDELTTDEVKYLISIIDARLNPKN